jgi:hypothetical protein
MLRLSKKTPSLGARDLITLRLTVRVAGAAVSQRRHRPLPAFFERRSYQFGDYGTKPRCKTSSQGTPLGYEFTALQPGPRFHQIGDGDGGASPIPDTNSGTGTKVPSPSPGKSGTGTGTGTGVSAPCYLQSHLPVPHARCEVGWDLPRRRSDSEQRKVEWAQAAIMV